MSVSEQASNMKDTAEVVKAALDESERAQNVAMDAIQLAQNNTKGTLDLLITVSLTSDLQDYSSVLIQKWFSPLHLKKMYSTHEKKISFTHERKTGSCELCTRTKYSSEKENLYGSRERPWSFLLFYAPLSRDNDFLSRYLDIKKVVFCAKN